MPIVSKNTLKILAAFVWIIGGIFLLLKCGSLFYEAKSMQPENNFILLGIILGFLLGGLKARFLMVNFCKQNLNRISKLKKPKVYQFFTPIFFAALILMIFAGSLMSLFAHGNFFLLLAVAVLDLGIGTGLLASSHVFFTTRK
jgi:hypothetical protein